MNVTSTPLLLGILIFLSMVVAVLLLLVHRARPGTYQSAMTLMIRRNRKKP